VRCRREQTRAHPPRTGRRRPASGSGCRDRQDPVAQHLAATRAPCEAPQRAWISITHSVTPEVGPLLNVEAPMATQSLQTQFAVPQPALAVAPHRFARRHRPTNGYSCSSKFSGISLIYQIGSRNTRSRRRRKAWLRRLRCHPSRAKNRHVAARTRLEMGSRSMLAAVFCLTIANLVSG
jgi:hypothetical protein